MLDILNTLLLGLCFLALFGLAEWLYHKAKVKAELTRKLVHFGTGFLTLLFPVLLSNHWFVLLLCSSFALILIGSLQYKLLPSINAIDRPSHGSLLYPISVYGCYLAYVFYDYKLVLFYLPVLTLAVCDPLAALFGKRFPYGKYKIGISNKTMVGSAAFFISSFILTWCIAFYLHPHGLQASAVLTLACTISCLATISEALSGRGLDNLTIPMCVLGILLSYQFPVI